MSCCPEHNIVPRDNGTEVCRSCGNITVGDIWGTEEQQRQYDDDICRSDYVSEETKQRTIKISSKKNNHNMTGYINTVCRQCSLPPQIPDSALDIYDEYLISCPRVQSPEQIAIICIVISCCIHKIECPVADKNDLSKKLLKLTLYVPKYAKYFELLDIPGRKQFNERALPIESERELKKYLQEKYQERWPFESCIPIITRFLTKRIRIHS